MKAPDEIYVLCDEDGSVYAASEVNVLPENIKYLRADLAVKKKELMEWLDEQLTASYNRFDVLGNLAYSKVIDKIKSL